MTIYTFEMHETVLEGTLEEIATMLAEKYPYTVLDSVVKTTGARLRRRGER